MISFIDEISPALQHVQSCGKIAHSRSVISNGDITLQIHAHNKGRAPSCAQHTEVIKIADSTRQNNPNRLICHEQIAQHNMKLKSNCFAGCRLECGISCDEETASMKFFKILRSSPDIFQEKNPHSLSILCSYIP